MSRRTLLARLGFKAFVGTALITALVPAAVHAQALPMNYPLPEATIVDAQKRPLDLKKYRGKAMVVAVMSSTCVHCIQALAALKKLQGEYNSKTVQIVGAFGDDNAKDNLGLLQGQYQTGFPLTYIDQANIIKIAKLGPKDRPFVPILIFVDSKGMVRMQVFGNDYRIKENQENFIRATVTMMLREGSAEAAKADASKK